MSPFGWYSGFDLMESMFPILFGVVFLIIIGVFVAVAVQGVRRYAKNEASPALTVAARVVGRRENVTGHMGGAGGHFHHHAVTSYYVTFEVESGDRLELGATGQEYGMLAEGDSGRLTFQGTRYQGFDRTRGSV